MSIQPVGSFGSPRTPAGATWTFTQLFFGVSRRVIVVIRNGCVSASTVTISAILSRASITPLDAKSLCLISYA